MIVLSIEGDDNMIVLIPLNRGCMLVLIPVNRGREVILLHAPRLSVARDSKS